MPAFTQFYPAQANTTEEIWVREVNTLNSTVGSGFRANQTHINPTTPLNLASSAHRSSPFLSAHLDNTTQAGLTSYRDGVGLLKLRFINKMPSENVKIYVSGLVDGKVAMLGDHGEWEFPSTTSSVPELVTLPVATRLGALNATLNLNLPTYIESARVWIVEGDLKFYVVGTPNGAGLVEPAAVNPKDPSSDMNFGFVELSWGPAFGLYADITAVDFVGLPLGIELEDKNPAIPKRSILGPTSDAVVTLCDKLTAQAARDGKAWDDLCHHDSKGTLRRVLAPSNVNPKIWGTYYHHYVDRVWKKYSAEDLFIETQVAAGRVACRVTGEELMCAGDNRGFVKPTAEDIFGCNTGPFAIREGDSGIHLAVVPRLCAALHRATLFLEGGNVQPGLDPEKYYTNPAPEPKNWYSKFVHDIQHERRGYAFSYDDVTSDYKYDQSGLLASQSPDLLTVIVGGS
jgi:hypothetical protein